MARWNVAVLPALHVALGVVDDLDHRLAGIRRREGLGELSGDPEPHQRQRVGSPTYETSRTDDTAGCNGRPSPHQFWASADLPPGSCSSKRFLYWHRCLGSWDLGKGLAAIDDQALTGDEGGAGACEVDGGVADVAEFAEPAGGDDLLHLVEYFLAECS